MIEMVILNTCGTILLFYDWDRAQDLMLYFVRLKHLFFEITQIYLDYGFLI